MVFGRSWTGGTSEATEMSVMGRIAEDKAGLMWGFFPWLLLHNPRLLCVLTFLNSLCLPVSQKETEATGVAPRYQSSCAVMERNHWLPL